MSYRDWYFRFEAAIPAFVITFLVVALGGPVLMWFLGVPLLVSPRVGFPLWAAWLSVDSIIGLICFLIGAWLLRQEAVKGFNDFNTKGGIFSWGVGCLLGVLIAWLLFAPKTGTPTVREVLTYCAQAGLIIGYIALIIYVIRGPKYPVNWGP